MAQRKPKRREPSVWVVEMWNDVYRRAPARWEPCSDAANNKQQAMDRIAQWRERNVSKFQIAEYRRVPTPKRKRSK